MTTSRQHRTLIVGALCVLAFLAVGVVAQAAGERALRDLDAIWGAVWDEYVDPFFNGVDWHRLPDSVRPLLEQAETEEEAYRHLADMVNALGDPGTFLVEPQPAYTLYET